MLNSANDSPSDKVYYGEVVNINTTAVMFLDLIGDAYSSFRGLER